MSARLIRRFLVVAVLLAVGASLASASTLTFYIDVFGGVPVPNASAPPTQELANTPAVSFQVPQFNLVDPNPGYFYALSGVALTLDWSAAGTVTVVNFSCSFGFTVCQDGAFTDAMATVPVTVSVIGDASGSGTINTFVEQAAGTAFYQAPNGPVNNWAGLTDSGSNSWTSNNLGFYSGTGSFTAQVSSGVENNSGNTSAQDISFSGSATGGGILAVQYSYLEEVYVPEPVTMALVGGALLGLGAFARIKRGRKAKV